MDLKEFVFGFLIFLAGFIDSLVGGGGLITVPTLSLLLGPGTLAIGTNKILGTCAALTALLIYARKGHLKLNKGIPFVLGICFGTVLGALTSPHLPQEIFKWLILGMSPFLLFLILRKDFLVKKFHQTTEIKTRLLIFLGLAAGFYDGVFGPGGGTFMFLSLYLFGGLPLLEAIATSKLANTFSAGMSLATYSAQGYVNWNMGFRLMGFIVLGAVIGSSLKNEWITKLVRPLLIIVVTILVFRL